MTGESFNDRCKRVMSEHDWKSCPCCQREVSYLEPQTTLDKGIPAIEICLTCAKSFDGIEYARQIFPLEGAILIQREIGCIVERGNMVVTVIPSFAGFSLRLNGDSEKKEYRPRSAVEAWGVIRRLLEIPSPAAAIVEAPKPAARFGGFNYED